MARTQRRMGHDAGVPIPLMLATLTDRRDFGGDWLLERKFDGERCVARKEGGDVRLESRAGKDLTATSPEVRAALVTQRARGFLLDGEVVAYQGGQTKPGGTALSGGLTTRAVPAGRDSSPSVPMRRTPLGVRRTG